MAHHGLRTSSRAQICGLDHATLWTWIIWTTRFIVIYYFQSSSGRQILWITYPFLQRICSWGSYPAVNLSCPYPLGWTMRTRSYPVLKHIFMHKYNATPTSSAFFCSAPYGLKNRWGDKIRTWLNPNFILNFSWTVPDFVWTTPNFGWTVPNYGKSATTECAEFVNPAAPSRVDFAFFAMEKGVLLD
jgi:hypothetical protein